MLDGRRVFITGGAGFIGSTCARLLAGKNEIVLFDNLRRNAMKHTLEGQTDIARLIEGDVTDFAALDAAIDEFKPTHIIHAAGIAGINTVATRPVTTLEVNMVGTANILKAARRQQGVERIVTFSTSEIFGSRAVFAGHNSPAEIGAVGEPRWVYAASKLGAEHLAFAHFVEYKLPTVSVRPFNVYGPGQVGEGAMSIFVQRAIKNEPIIIHNDGGQIRSWCFVDDMVDGVMLCLTSPNAPGKAFNIGNPRATETVYGLAKQVIRITGSSSTISFAPHPGVDIEVRIPDISWPREQIGFEPKVDIEEGIQRTAEFYRNAKMG